MRALFVSTFAHGHVFPLVPLALACREAGHAVLWASNGAAVLLVVLAGIRCVEAGLSGEALTATVSGLQTRAAQLAPRDRAAFMFPTMFGEMLSPPVAADLLPLARANGYAHPRRPSVVATHPRTWPRTRWASHTSETRATHQLAGVRPARPDPRLR